MTTIAKKLEEVAKNLAKMAENSKEQYKWKKIEKQHKKYQKTWNQCEFGPMKLTLQTYLISKIKEKVIKFILRRNYIHFLNREDGSIQE